MFLYVTLYLNLKSIIFEKKPNYDFPRAIQKHNRTYGCFKTISLT
jgi:hypothetical protein